MIVGLSDQNAQQKALVRHDFVIGGKKLAFESGKLALLADGSCVIRDEVGNYLLTSVGVRKEANPSASFFPLTVEFQEKYYAAGKIGGNRFMKRESRPSETAVLNSRLIDRPIRPMFPKGVLNEVQIISTILSSSGTSDFGFYGITGASLSLLLSGCKDFEGPVAGVRIMLMDDGSFAFDPSMEELKTAKLDMTFAGTEDAITMVESQGKEVPDSVILQGFEFGHALIKDFCRAQKDFMAKYSQIHQLPEFSLTIKSKNESLYDKVLGLVTDDRIKALYHVGKAEFHDRLEMLEDQVKADLGYTEDTEEMKGSDIVEYVYAGVREHMRKNVLGSDLRLDGRKLDEVRAVRSECGILPRVHGSVLFQRGMTQALSITTLGGPGDIQIIDDMYEEDTKRYIHHYNFPPFSVGEVKPLRGPGRREIGHGRLAEKALEPVLPGLENFPYFIRVVSEITTCNGSSSMASVCGSSLSLMDAGVPITNMVAGVAMGMVYDDDSGKFKVLSDIQAQEDFLGDLDFKIASTDKGITALQMDCKIKGLSLDVIRSVMGQSGSALDYIRGEMRKELAAPRPNLSPYAPLIMSFVIPVERIREVIGKGGETIQRITKEFNVEIDINDDGTISITAKTQDTGNGAVNYIKAMLKEPEVGDIEVGKVVRILEGVGAIVEFGQGKSGMIHISKIARERVTNIEDFIKTGESVKVRILSVDKEKGRVGLERMISE